MNINGQHHSQFELFPKKNDHYATETYKSRPQIKDLTLSVENIIVLCIILVMTCVLFFSFGVERGRHLVSNANQEAAPAATEATSAEEVAVSATAPAAVEVSAAGSAQTVAPTASPAGAQTATGEATADREIIQVPVERVLTDADFFTIQVASYKYESAAQREAKRLSESGYEIFVLAKGTYSIVCVGKF